MRQPLDLWVIGGDSRCHALAQALSGDGHTVHTYALGPDADPALASDTLAAAGVADCVILPLPAQRGELLNAPQVPAPPTLAQVLDALTTGQLCCGGKLSPDTRREAERRGVRLVDYFDREELAVANAVPKALAV